jgi:hypothetical protein
MYTIYGAYMMLSFLVMASSVSSERAFSSAGITISKRRNRLKPDIVEALQFLKCSYHRDLLFREEASAQHEINGLEYEDMDEIVDKIEEDGGVVLVEVNDVLEVVIGRGHPWVIKR